MEDAKYFCQVQFSSGKKAQFNFKGFFFLNGKVTKTFVCTALVCSLFLAFTQFTQQSNQITF